MSGFSAPNPDDNASYQALWASADDFKDEPYFVLVHPEGSVGLVTLQYIREAMAQVHDGDRELDSVYQELYIKSPNSSALERITLGFAGKPGKVKLIAVGETAVEWTFDL